MVDRQSKELYQQQLAAHAAWLSRGAAAGYSAAAAQHPGFAASAAHGSSTNAYENYMLHNMLGGASNILGNGAKDMSGFSSPFRFPGQLGNFNYQRPLPAHSPLSAHMKGSGSSSTPIAAHMISNPYQYTGNYGLNPSYGAGAMNPNYLQSNMANQSQETANYMAQSAGRFRHQFDPSQLQKEQGGGSQRQDNSRRQAAGLANGGMTQEATNAFNLQQLQAAYSQAALNSNAAMLKDASKAKTPANNYLYYPTSTSATTTASSSFSGSTTTTDLNDQIAKELLSRFGDRLTPQFLQRLQQTASISQFQQNQLALQQQRSETQTADNSTSRQETKAGGKNNMAAPPPTQAKDLSQPERNSLLDYSGRNADNRETKAKEKESQSTSKPTSNHSTFMNKQAPHESSLNNNGQTVQSRDLHQAADFSNSQYQGMGFHKNDANARLSEYAAQYQRAQQKYSQNLMASQSASQQQQNTNNIQSSYQGSAENPASNSSAIHQQASPASAHSGQPQVSPASVHSPAVTQISPVNSQVSPAAQQQPFSPNHIASADPKLSPYSQSQISPYSQHSPQMSPYPHQSPKMSPYSQQQSPKMSPYDQQSPKMSPYSQQSPKMSPYSQPSPKMSPYSQPSPKMSPYSQQSPKMSPYSQVSPAYHQQPMAAPQTSPSYLPESIGTSSSCSLQQKPESVYPVPSFAQAPDQAAEQAAEPPKPKPADLLTTKATTLRSATDSPRLETPPGLHIPVNSGEGTTKQPASSPVVGSAADSLPSPASSASKATTTATTTAAATTASLFSNPISGMASMTNKIKLLESKMQTSKSKSSAEKNLEDNSLKNWWKPQTDLLRKARQQPIMAKATVEETKKDDAIHSAKESGSEAISYFSKSHGLPLDAETTSVESRDIVNDSFKIDKHRTSGKDHDSLSNQQTKDPASRSDSLNFSLSCYPESLPSAKQDKPSEDALVGHEKHRDTSKEIKYAKDDLKSHSNSSNESSSTLKLSQKASTTTDKHSRQTSVSAAAVAKPPEPVLSSLTQTLKKSLPSHSTAKVGRDPSPVPYDPQSQRSLDSYATPNLERMEIKNSGIPGPSAVTWKRKSTEDSPNNFQKSKKRRSDKSSSGGGNDIYHFEEDVGGAAAAAAFEEEKLPKGPVYKYKSALISRDNEHDACQSHFEQNERESGRIAHNKSGDVVKEDKHVTKKKNKRPKHEEWSVAKTKPAKPSKPHVSEASEPPPLRNAEKQRSKSPPPSSNTLFQDKIEASVSGKGVVEPVKKEVAADKWYQAFGAGEVRSKKRIDKNIHKVLVKTEPDEDSAKSVLDIPPELRRKPRPNFGGVSHFSADWNRQVKRHHDRCRLPGRIDSSAALSPKILVGHSTPKKSYEDYARKDMVSPPHIMTLEREKMEAKALTDIGEPATPTKELGPELPSILETILENRKKLRLATKMGRMYQIPFKKEKKRMMRMRMTKSVMENSSAEDNMGLIPTPGLPPLDPATRDHLLGSQASSTYGNFRPYTLNKYLDYGEHEKPKIMWTPEVLDSKTRSRTNATVSGPSFKDIFGLDTPLAKVKPRKERREANIHRDEPTKSNKAKGRREPQVGSALHSISREKVAEKELDNTFAFSQEVGEPTEDENILQAELGELALNLLEDNPSWVKQVTIQNLVVWEPVQPVLAKKKKPKKKKGKKCYWDFPSGKKKAKTSRDVSRANSPTHGEIHDIEYTLDNVVQESNRWVVDKNAGETILQRACKMGYPDVVAYAVGMQDMSVKEKDYAGFTPIDKAAFRGNHEVVRILLKYGADASSGVKGTRAVHDAVEVASRETVEALLSYGADPLLHNYSGSMPIDLAEGEKNMKKYLVNILADLHGKAPNVRGIAPPVERWNVSHAPEFYDASLDPRISESFGREPEEEDVDSLVFEVSSHPLPTEYQLIGREGTFVLYRELKEFAKRFGHHKADIKNKCYIIEMKKSEFLKTSRCCQLDRREVEVVYHVREEEDTIILVKVDKFLRKIFNAEIVSA